MFLKNKVVHYKACLYKNNNNKIVNRIKLLKRKLAT